MRSFALTPGRLIILILVFLLAALAALLVHLPASWAWSQLESELALPPEVQVKAVGGTLWSGTSLVSVRAAQLPSKTLRLSWTLDLPTLAGRWPLRWRLESPQSWLQGEAAWLGRDTVEVQVSRGLVALSEFATLARQNGLTLPGAIALQGLHLELDLELGQQRLLAARGSGRWEGGLVAWEVGDQRGSAELPALVADLREQGGGVAVGIRTEADAAELIDLALLPDGMMNLAVRRRLLELSGMPAGQGAPADTVFRIQQRVPL